jgi:signal peptidase I
MDARQAAAAAVDATDELDRPDLGVPPTDDLTPEAEEPAEVAARTSRTRTLVRDFVESLVLAGLLFVGLQFVMQNTVVKGISMMPNYVTDQRVLVNKLAYRFGQPRRGEVIVFHAPNVAAEDFIKRVIGLPGETVEGRGGRVYVNGQLLDEPYRPVVDENPFGPYTVHPGEYFVLGDNRPSSNDSRTWAPGGEGLAGARIVGRVMVSIWPPETWGWARSDRPGPAHDARLDPYILQPGR